MTDASPGRIPTGVRSSRDLLVDAVEGFVDYDDPSEAADLILFINRLMRLLDRVEPRLAEV